MEDAVTHQSMHIYENNIDFLLKNDLLYLLNFNKLLDFLVVFLFYSYMQLLLMHIDFHTHKNWFSFIINEQDYLPSKKN